MTTKENKTEIVQFRLTGEQLEMLDRAYKSYISRFEEVITRSEYIRRMLMMACLKEVGLIEVIND